MQIQKGQVKYKDRNDIICTYGITDDGKQYYFLDGYNLSNGNIIATTSLVEAIDPGVVSVSIGLIDANGGIIIPFENKTIKPLNNEVLLVEKAKPTSQSVLESINLRNDPSAAAKLVTTPATIKDNINLRMGSNGRFVFNDQFSEATLCDLNGKNIIDNELYSFIGMNDNKVYMSKNLVQSEVKEFNLDMNVNNIVTPVESNDGELDITEAVVSKDVIDEAINSQMPTDDKTLVKEENEVNNTTTETTEESAIIPSSEEMQSVASTLPAIEDAKEETVDALVENPEEKTDVFAVTEDSAIDEKTVNPVSDTQEEVDDSTVEEEKTTEVKEESNATTEEVKEESNVTIDQAKEESNATTEDAKEEKIETPIVSDESIETSEDNVKTPVDEEVAPELPEKTEEQPVVNDENIGIPVAPLVDINDIANDEGSSNDLSLNIENTFSMAEDGIKNNFIPDTIDNNDDMEDNNKDISLNDEEEIVENSNDVSLNDDEEIDANYSLNDGIDESENSFDNNLFEENNIEESNDDTYTPIDDTIDNDDYMSYSLNPAKDSIIEETAVTMSNLIKLNRSQQRQLSNSQEHIIQLNNAGKRLSQKTKSQAQEIEMLKNKLKNYEIITSKLESKNSILENRVHDQERLIDTQKAELDTLRPQVEGKQELAKLLQDAKSILGSDSYEEDSYSKRMAA